MALQRKLHESSVFVVKELYVSSLRWNQSMISKTTEFNKAFAAIKISYWFPNKSVSSLNFETVCQLFI